MIFEEIGMVELILRIMYYIVYFMVVDLGLNFFYGILFLYFGERVLEWVIKVVY